MLSLTADAVEVIRSLTTHLPEGGLRIVPQDWYNGQAALAISVAEAPAVTDVVVAEEDTQVFVDEQAVPYLADKVLDATMGDDAEIRFTIREW